MKFGSEWGLCGNYSIGRCEPFEEWPKEMFPQVRWEDEYPTEYNLYDDEVMNRLEAKK